MNYEQLIDSITPEAYQNLKAAVETGRWPDGNLLSQQQREHSLQAIIAYELKHLPPEERTGYVPTKPTACDHTEADNGNDAEAPIKWQ